MNVIIALAFVAVAALALRIAIKNLRCPHCGALAVKHTGHVWRCKKCGEVKQRRCHTEGCKAWMQENGRGVWECPKCHATSEWTGPGIKRETTA